MYPDNLSECIKGVAEIREITTTALRIQMWSNRSDPIIDYLYERFLDEVERLYVRLSWAVDRLEESGVKVDIQREARLLRKVTRVKVSNDHPNPLGNHFQTMRIWHMSLLDFWKLSAEMSALDDPSEILDRVDKLVARSSEAQKYFRKHQSGW